MRFQCPMCQGIISADEADMGSTVQCGHCNKPVSVPSSRIAPGSMIGDFIMMHELGRGGMGIVYKAHQISLDRPAAVKILADSYAQNADFVVGFIKEARAAAKLNHPNIVQAYAVGDDDGIFYFAMELVDGETMSSILKQKNVIPVNQAVDIVRQIAEALDYAWQEEKLVHRDIKPDNIMLTSSGRAKLADLGLAKVGNETGRTDGEEVMGTPQYISPEQLTGEALDNRTDIYCLGATFYHLLTGRFPYEGSSAVEIARQHLEGTLIPPCQVNPAIPENVSKVVEKMMEKDPANRYQNAGLLAEDLALIKRGQNPAPAGSPKVGLPRPGVPKLHVPGIKKPAGQVPVAPPPAVPQQAAPGGKPKLSLSARPTAVPVQPVGNDASAQVPVHPVPGVQAPVSDQSKKKSKSGSGIGKNVVRIIAGVLVVLVLGAAGSFAYFKFVKKQDPVQMLSQAKEMIAAQTKEPEPSEFMKASGSVIALVRSGSSSKETARQCYEFLKKRLLPETPEERNIQQEIIACFAGQDESQIETARMKAVADYEAELKLKQQAAEEAAKAKMEADRRAQLAAAERRLREEEQRRRNAERAESQRKRKGFENRMNEIITQMVLDLARYGENKHDREGLNKVFERNAAIRDRVARPEWLDQRSYDAMTGKVITRAKKLQKIMQKAWMWDKIFTDGDSRLNGMNIELKYNICVLTGIKDGVITAKAGSKEFSESVAKLLHNKKFRQFAQAASGKINERDSLPYFFFWRGAYPAASQVALDISPKARNAYSAFVTAYLAEVKKKPRLIRSLSQKFRGVPEYDRLNPPKRQPPRRPPPRATPKKPTQKKTAPKKPAAKKK